MAAVLSPMDFRSRIDDLGFTPSASTDWRAKYMEVADMLAETRAELDDFQHSSKELEEELERELERTEKAQSDLKLKVSKVETEREEWKNKFMSLQTSFNTTTTSLQRELDTLRQEQAKVRKQLVQLEMGNDDLERNERIIASSLADVESKYSKVLEEKILLEQELIDKASLEEECQRLRDELRDINMEVSILKDQLEEAKKAAENTPATSTADDASDHSSYLTRHRTASDDDLLLKTPPPADFQLSDMVSTFETDMEPKAPRPVSASFAQSALLSRAGFMTSASIPAPSSSSSTALARSQSIPSISPSSPSRLPYPRTPRPPSAAGRTLSGIPTTTSKSKGVQMVSEMRQRVRNLEQRLHSRVPRLRRTDERTEMTPESQRAASPGWVLIMEESPMGHKGSSPSPSPAPPGSFRPLHMEGSITSRRPSSRLSATPSGTGTTSIPTHVSRPTTPGLSSSLASKRASVPTGPPTSTVSGRRPSLGSSLAPNAAALSFRAGVKSPPPLPRHKDLPFTPPTSMPPPPMPTKRPPSSLGMSRIGRPSSLGSVTRKPGGGIVNKDGLEVDQEGRLRSGSLAASNLHGSGSFSRSGR